MSLQRLLLLALMPGQKCVPLPSTLFLAKPLRYSHAPDLTGGILPVTGMYLILWHYLPSGAPAKPVSGEKEEAESEII